MRSRSRVSFARTGRALALAILVSILLVTPLRATYAADQSAGAKTTVQIPTEDLRLFELLTQVREIIQTYHTKDVSLEQICEGALRGVVDALNDPYSEYMDPEQFKAFNASLEGEYGGIGISIDLINGSIVVISTFGGSPAEGAGIKPGDIVVGADGKVLEGKTPQDATSVIRGEPGTTVTVTLKRPSTGEILKLTIVRELVKQTTLDLKDLGDGLYYIRIAQFTSDTGTQFPVIMKYLRSVGVKGLILDLRNNPGGLLDSCLAVARQLVPEGPIVELRGKEFEQMLVNSGDTEPVPVAVLVNKGSASASEILAGAIRDRGVGILIGEPTFGKACVQSMIPLGDDVGGLRLTVAEYYTPSGESLAVKGLEPGVRVTTKDVQVPAKIAWARPIEPGTVGLDVLAVQQALAFLQIDPGELDGVFGPKTADAVGAFCEEHDIEFSGIVTGETAGKLNLAVTESAGHQPDIVFEKAKELLARKLQKGYWQ